MLLTPDARLFADDVVFESSGDRPIPFDPGKAYVGTLEGKYIFVFLTPTKKR